MSSSTGSPPGSARTCPGSTASSRHRAGRTRRRSGHRLRALGEPPGVGDRHRPRRHRHRRPARTGTRSGATSGSATPRRTTRCSGSWPTSAGAPGGSSPSATPAPSRTGARHDGPAPRAARAGRAGLRPGRHDDDRVTAAIRPVTTQERPHPGVGHAPHLLGVGGRRTVHPLPDDLPGGQADQVSSGETGVVDPSEARHARIAASAAAPPGRPAPALRAGRRRRFRRGAPRPPCRGGVRTTSRSRRPRRCARGPRDRRASPAGRPRRATGRSS